MPAPAIATLSPVVTSVEGVANYTKPLAFTVQQGQLVTLHWTMRDNTGCVVDLTPYGPVLFRVREALSWQQAQNPSLQATCTVLDAVHGLVSIDLPAGVTDMPGISVCEFALQDLAGHLLLSNVCYLVVNRGQFGPALADLGPPTLPEIRLHMRDTSPADNLWLGVQEFDNAEVVACVMRPIEYFNETNPPLDFRYNTANFPWRYNWLNGIVACLYQMAALHYTRVHLPYSAGGTQVDDKNKAQEYTAVGDKKWEEFKQWVLLKKVQINAEQAFMTTGSSYDYTYYGGSW